MRIFIVRLGFAWIIDFRIVLWFGPVYLFKFASFYCIFSELWCLLQFIYKRGSVAIIKNLFIPILIFTLTLILIGY